MRFNKTIREYLEKELNKKIEVIKENDTIRKEYHERQEQAIAELDELRLDFYTKVSSVLTKYGMDLMCRNWKGEITKAPSAEKMFPFAKEYIIDSGTRNAIREKDSELSKKKAEYMENIELECSLGADRDAFMKMIADIKF